MKKKEIEDKRFYEGVWFAVVGNLMYAKPIASLVSVAINDATFSHAIGDILALLIGILLMSAFISKEAD